MLDARLEAIVFQDLHQHETWRDVEFVVTPGVTCHFSAKRRAIGVGLRDCSACVAGKRNLEKRRPMRAAILKTTVGPKGGWGLVLFPNRLIV